MDPELQVSKRQIFKVDLVEFTLTEVEFKDLQIGDVFKLFDGPEHPVAGFWQTVGLPYEQDGIWIVTADRLVPREQQ